MLRSCSAGRREALWSQRAYTSCRVKLRASNSFKASSNGSSRLCTADNRSALLLAPCHNPLQLLLYPATTSRGRKPGPSLCRRPNTFSRALHQSSTCQATLRAASRPGANLGHLSRRPSSRAQPCTCLGRKAARLIPHGRMHHRSSKVCRVVCRLSRLPVTGRRSSIAHTYQAVRAMCPCLMDRSEEQGSRRRRCKRGVRPSDILPRCCRAVMRAGRY